MSRAQDLHLLQERADQVDPRLGLLCGRAGSAAPGTKSTMAMKNGMVCVMWLEGYFQDSSWAVYTQEDWLWRRFRRHWWRLKRLMVPCACVVGATGKGSLLEELTRVREACPALKRILIPDDAWPMFEARVKELIEKRDTMGHNAIAYYALDRGTLGAMCSPIHRYLLDGDIPKPNVDLGALLENWIRKEEDVERHRRSKSFMGKLVELLYIEYLESQGHKVVALDAVERGPSDAALERDGKRQSLEVKYLGVDDDGFEAIVKSVREGPAPHVGDLYGSINFVVFRIYEAAKQLQPTAKEGRGVAFVIDNQTLHTVEMQLTNKWIDWSAAKLYDNASQKSKEFMDEQRKKYPNLDQELAAVIRELEGITFVKLVHGFRFEPLFEVKPQ